MSRYRRANTEGASYFFTVVTYRRQTLLCNEKIRRALRQAIEAVRVDRPFEIDAWVLLPDHLHCIWTLPLGDADYATRWGMIKRTVSLACGADYGRPEWINASKRKHRESTLWQRRYWEHRIRDDRDFSRHMDYIHYNPVKHGLCVRAVDWPYSTFHRHVRNGVYTMDWGYVKIDIAAEGYGE
ncbi:REP-associated tyrosine transposase [Sedimenticola hydrogenitrophicus]|uniref:REP-associated tyrosine transposase n=1 Tax=Sedimenticola hydrogenitrophicus TaxID=2967975 RepID=UPI0023B0B51A|nr:transposase [Sedimenticola hydrogenitrophicus]